MVPFCIEDQVLTPGAVFFGDPALSFWVDALLRTSGASLGRLDVTSCQDLWGCFLLHRALCSGSIFIQVIQKP